VISEQPNPDSALAQHSSHPAYRQYFFIMVALQQAPDDREASDDPLGLHETQPKNPQRLRSSNAA
jgi:hypothetical protein